MHTHLGVFEKLWSITTQGTGTARLLTTEQIDKVDQRSNCFPFTKRQQNLFDLGSKIPKRSRDKLTAMNALLISLKGLLEQGRLCTCNGQYFQLSQHIREAFGLEDRHT